MIVGSNVGNYHVGLYDTWENWFSSTAPNAVSPPNAMYSLDPDTFWSRHLREVGETRSCTEIEGHFKRNFDVCGVTTACEYLADQGLLGKAATPVRLTKKSNVLVQELAFFYLGEPPDEF